MLPNQQVGLNLLEVKDELASFWIVSNLVEVLWAIFTGLEQGLHHGRVLL